MNTFSIVVGLTCIAALVLGVTDASGAAPSPESTFGDVARIDLSHWKLTLPTNASGKYGGHASEISAETLVDGFKDSHFHVAPDGALVFWCPVAGAKTDGTEFPRCELREMLKPGDEDTNWTTAGTHILRARCRLTQVPSNPKVVIGQIHGYSGKARPLFKLQYYKGRVEALVKISPDSGNDRKLTFADVKLDQDIRYEIKVQGNMLSITVNGETQSEDLEKNDPDWLGQTFYFKAGVYPQDNDGPETEGAKAVFTELKVTHQE